jgi:peptidyl-prolyl cis-trans isomerase B (cyclophilin B)
VEAHLRDTGYDRQAAGEIRVQGFAITVITRKEGNPLAANLKSQVADVQKTLDFAHKSYTAELDTSKGSIGLIFLPEVAPGHVKNFLALAKVGFYNGLTFHRIIKGFMIQGGCPLGTGTGDAGYKIKAEFNATPHEAGVLSMARAQDPDSAGSQFFICLEHHAHLDRQYTAFGKVADKESLATVRSIGDVATRGDKPVEKVTIHKVTVTEVPK